MSMFENTFVNLPPYVQGIQIVLIHCEKVRISSPRCDNYEVHYIPGVPVNRKCLSGVLGELCFSVYIQTS